MSRVANSPIPLPSGVECTIGTQEVVIKGQHGQLSLAVKEGVRVEQTDSELRVSSATEERTLRALAGTTRALLNNMVVGVDQKWERRLELQGVGFRAQGQGRSITLQLGFSQPVVYELPEGIDAATPATTEIVISGVDRQQVGQVAAEIRSIRPPEPYKGKGVRYAGEQVRRKEAKKKQ